MHTQQLCNRGGSTAGAGGKMQVPVLLLKRYLKEKEEAETSNVSFNYDREKDCSYISTDVQPILQKGLLKI